MIVGVIPARGGSEGIPGKNMIDLGGRPLLDYSFAVAEACRSLDRIVLSTNMPDAIDWARRHYARVETPFVRPEALSTASSSSLDVVLHAIDHLERESTQRVESVVLLQPTCPFRRAVEIDAAVARFKEEQLDSLIGVSRVWHHPSDYVQAPNGGKKGFRHVFRDPTWQRRQDFPEVWFITGALYVARVEYLRQTRGFCDELSSLHVMSEESMVDIDSPFDLAIARGLVAVGAVPR
jgi:CMP-N,N'-diacetyllegionaminic acid synthase